MTKGKVHHSKPVASRTTKLMGGYLHKRSRSTSLELERFWLDLSSYERTVEELKISMEANKSLTLKFLLTLESLNEQRTVLLEKRLRLLKKKLDKRIKKINGWRKAWKVIRIAGIVILCIGSVIAAVIGLPAAIEGGLAAANQIPWPSLEKLIDSNLKDRCDFAKELKELLSSVEAGVALAEVWDLDTIQGLVKMNRGAHNPEEAIEFKSAIT